MNNPLPARKEVIKMKEKIKYSYCPNQVIFEDEENNICLGIAYRDEIICCESGDVIPSDEVNILEIYKNWYPLIEE